MAGKFAATVKPIIKILRSVRERDAFGALYIIDNIRYGVTGRKMEKIICRQGRHSSRICFGRSK